MQKHQGSLTVAGVIIALSGIIFLNGAFSYQSYFVSKIQSSITTFSETGKIACPTNCSVNMVCGSDGKNYCNECAAKAAHVAVAHQGHCATR